ncbi:MAG: DUF1552 domain-containing protein [Planctomycetota bacterium]
MMRAPMDRRRFLRAAGVALALPRLETFREDAAPAPRRLAVLFMPNGVHVPSWTPKETGAAYRLTPTLEPLRPHRDRVLVLSGLRNRNAFEGEGHYVKTTSLLSGARVKRTGGHDVRCGTTMDQIAAAVLGRDTPIPSLELGTEPVRNVVDMGYSTVYGAHVSWRSPTLPAAKEIRPRLVFERLVRGSRAGARPRDRRVVDLVLEEARALSRALSGRDRAKVDEYLDSVHALEGRIDDFARRRAGDEAEERRRLGLAADAVLPEARRDELDARDFPTRTRLMLDLVVAAFRADLTRVASFMFGNAVSGLNFSFLEGVAGGFHELSHHENRPEKTAQYALINRWHVEQLARMIQAMKEIPEGDSTLFENSAILFASGLGDGNAHDPKSLPVLVAGGLGGRLASGRHLVFGRDRKLCGLHLALLEALGVPTAQLGDADRPADGILV